MVDNDTATSHFNSTQDGRCGLAGFALVFGFLGRNIPLSQQRFGLRPFNWKVFQCVLGPVACPEQIYSIWGLGFNPASSVCMCVAWFFPAVP